MWQTRGELRFDHEENSVRTTPVGPEQPSPFAKAKQGSARSRDGFPPTNLRGLLESLSTLSHLRIRMGERGLLYTRLTKPMPLQAKAFQLRGVKVAWKGTLQAADRPDRHENQSRQGDSRLGI